MGLLEIGYHLIIDRTGAIHSIRDVLCVGSHCPGYNHTSVGVCLIGGLSEDGKHHENNFAPDQFQSLFNVAATFKHQWPFADIRGHNELRGYKSSGRKACPTIDMDVARQGLTDTWPGQTLSEMTNGRPRSPHEEDHASSGPGPGLPVLVA